jgi:hypothetical protein
MSRLYLDCDGVLADFDAGARHVLGMTPMRYQAKFGLGKFWAALARQPDFYATLPLMPDARTLFEAVRHLDPIVLTGLPRGDWAAPQKRRWVEAHFPGTKVITCMAVEKCRHCLEGDVLVDDTSKYQPLWEKAGGVFIHHRSAIQTLGALGPLFPSVMPPRALRPAPNRSSG